MKKWKQMIMDNMFLRNACSDIFGRYYFIKERGNFKPYIQYKIGPPENDWYLYFRKLPYPRQYNKAFIQRLVALDPSQAINFLSFHYKAYPNREEFINCLKLTLIESSCQVRDYLQRHKIAKAIMWTQLQSDLLQFDKSLKAEIQNLLQPTFNDPDDIMEHEVHQISELVSSGVRERLKKSI
ncbi:hypothetical protein [Niastella sp. OAS944]|uniref:hypothetical protein n=1 Tax=Niastella sp. OAS944 TaxID=2664089 RepID=UPI00347CCE85|nr:hypothetical protein [Chitinophagaceae bacterium OAS944]